MLHVQCYTSNIIIMMLKLIIITINALSTFIGLDYVSVSLALNQCQA